MQYHFSLFRAYNSTMRVRILVVEDNIPMLELISEVLSFYGADVCAIGDSQQAATLVNKEKFDGVFLDIVMPNMDGFELARRIRQSSLNEQTPIVFVTGLEDRKTLGRAFAAGGTFFLQKPIQKNKLLHLLNSTRGTMLAERRRCKRIPVQTEVVCQAGPRRIMGRSCNLSESGILFKSEGSLEAGSTVRLLFRLPGQTTDIEATGAVVRIGEEEQVGVSFTYISTRDRQCIRDFIACQPGAL